MQNRNQQESRIVAIGIENQNSTQSRLVTESPSSLRLQQLVDNGAVYVAQNLSSSQFATLQAIAALVLRPNAKRLAAHLDAALATGTSEALPFAPPSLAFDYHLGLDELDVLARTRTGYSFTELHTDLQDAILSLIASRDLTSRKIDLACWLEDLQTHTLALAA